MTPRIPEPESEYEGEGVPDMGYTLPQKEITGDPQEGLEPPRDFSQGSEEWGTTAAEEIAGEPLDLRLSREEPELTVADVAYEGEDADDPVRSPRRSQAGQLVESDEGARTDTEPDAVATDLGAGGVGFSAEESAMHIEPEV